MRGPSGSVSASGRCGRAGGETSELKRRKVVRVGIAYAGCERLAERDERCGMLACEDSIGAANSRHGIAERDGVPRGDQGLGVTTQSKSGPGGLAQNLDVQTGLARTV